MNSEEKVLFDKLLLPADSYDSNGVYWADLPLWRRIKFVNNVDSAETKKELSTTWTMFKSDPLSPLCYYFKNMVIPGAGLLLEG